jgi:hypothetical protein
MIGLPYSRSLVGFPSSTQTSPRPTGPLIPRHHTCVLRKILDVDAVGRRRCISHSAPHREVGVGSNLGWEVEILLQICRTIRYHSHQTIRLPYPQPRLSSTRVLLWVNYVTPGSRNLETSIMRGARKAACAGRIPRGPKLAILEETETRDLVDAPGGMNPRGPTRDFHAKDDAVDDIKRCVARLATSFTCRVATYFHSSCQKLRKTCRQHI